MPVRNRVGIDVNGPSRAYLISEVDAIMVPWTTLRVSSRMLVICFLSTAGVQLAIEVLVDLSQYSIEVEHCGR